MEFGKIHNLDTVNFTLPPGSAFNGRIWAAVEPVPASDRYKPSVFIGGPIWANKDYVGKVYPTHAKERDALPDSDVGYD